MPCDAGFLVALMTHEVPKIGALMWIATPTFDEEPSLDDVEQIASWRWPVFFPLGAAIRRRIFVAIGVVDIPEALRAFPTLRSGHRSMGYTSFTEVDGVRHQLGATTDATLPIYQIVNDTRLKEMVVSGWRPQDEW